MGREINRLSAKGVENASPGKHYDGAGLYLRVERNGSGRWVQRFRLNGREREMGLGASGDISLKAARKERDAVRALVASGLDPIKERDRRNRENAKDRPTLSAVAHECFEARKASLKGGGKAGRWLSPIELHVLPKLGATPIEDIDQRDIKDTLAPIWNEKVDTARKALQRLSLIVEHGAAMGLDVNPNACKLARSLLGKQVHAVKHIPSMPWQEVPAFTASLAGRGAVAEALLFAILTAVRSGPVRFARWADIDLDENIWTVPAEDMKGAEGKTAAFRVPLSDETLEVLRRVKPLEREGLVFPAMRKGVVSDMSMGMLMRRRELVYRPHGFRSSFRNWCEHIGADYLTAETALQHLVGGSVERAYRRDDLLEKRAALMQRWADHCAGRGSAAVREIRLGQKAI